MFVSSLIMGYEAEGFFPPIHLLYGLHNNDNISLKQWVNKFFAGKLEVINFIKIFYNSPIFQDGMQQCR